MEHGIYCGIQDITSFVDIVHFMQAHLQGQHLLICSIHSVVARGWVVVLKNR